MNCFENVVGLSENECPCFDLNKPTDADVSLSGLYLDELIFLSDLKKLENCENGSMWELMQKALKRAHRDIEVDLLKCIREKATLNIKPCNTYIGSLDVENCMDINKQYAGIKIELFNIEGACFVLKEICTLFCDSGQLNGHIIIKNADINTIQIPIFSDGSQQLCNELQAALEISQHSEYCDNVEIYVVYEVDSNIRPYDNSVSCNSCRYTGKECWSEYARVRGIQGDNLNDIDYWKTSNYMHGLILKGSFKCKENEVICNEELDFTTGLGQFIAYSIQYLAAYYLFEMIYFSHDPSIWTTVCKDDLDIMLPKLKDKYIYYLDCACKEIDLSNSDCFKCKGSFSINNSSLA